MLQTFCSHKGILSYSRLELITAGLIVNTMFQKPNICRLFLETIRSVFKNKDSRTPFKKFVLPIEYINWKEAGETVSYFKFDRGLKLPNFRSHHALKLRLYIHFFLGRRRSTRSSISYPIIVVSIGLFENIFLQEQGSPTGPERAICTFGSVVWRMYFDAVHIFYSSLQDTNFVWIDTGHSRTIYRYKASCKLRMIFKNFQDIPFPGWKAPKKFTSLQITPYST